MFTLIVIGFWSHFTNAFIISFTPMPGLSSAFLYLFAQFSKSNSLRDFHERGWKWIVNVRNRPVNAMHIGNEREREWEGVGGQQSATVHKQAMKTNCGNCAAPTHTKTSPANRDNIALIAFTFMTTILLPLYHQLMSIKYIKWFSLLHIAFCIHCYSL